MLFRSRDAWFWSKPEYFEQAQLYINGIKKLESVLPKYWYSDESDFGKGIKGCVSPAYWLEK